MPGEEKIIIAGGALLVLGVGKAAIDKKPIDKPLISGVIVVVLLSGLALFGPEAASFAGTLAIVALIGAVFFDGPELLTWLQSIQGKKA